MSSEPHRPAKLTVAVPLYHSSEWFDNIIQNVQRIPMDALVVLSDEVSSDNTAGRVAEYFAGDPRIQVRLRHGAPGWREHCNSLIEECDTEFFSFLPHDDFIEEDYYPKILQALNDNDSAGIAFGRIVPERSAGKQTPMQDPPFKLGIRAPWLEAIELERYWNLGIPFRGVIRRRVLQTIPSLPGDQFADQVWMFGMALSAHLLPVHAAYYFKRYHRNNTHSKWRMPNRTQRRTELINEIRRAFGKSHPAERFLRVSQNKQREVAIHGAELSVKLAPGVRAFRE